jgi:hypothetical protein
MNRDPSLLGAARPLGTVIPVATVLAAFSSPRSTSATPRSSTARLA